MLDWLGSDGDQLRIAFTKVFGSRYESFGSQTLHIGGLSDGKKGVQWNVGCDPRDGSRFAGINLEGMQYDDWPVARLIEREMRKPSLVALVRSEQGLADVVMHWRRDYWQKQSRPAIEEGSIGVTPLPLGELTEESWRATLVEAQACLDSKRSRRGRAKQTVTLGTGEQVEGAVSPHLVFRVTSPGIADWEPFFRDVKTRLQPLHRWASERAGKPIAF
jgi:hypothetical protein